ncbi:Smr/MutS family protein [Jannaschia ovalis]|uniref:Smr/MutS family protein n=1 Tax=Jannaschia ovalis TaxID=3038773 RepID=A0ABY8LIQ2_9RHOB|nr:Smr/MutS family protein [Jannaschia sp. GRR-S6-38]WGH80283.1 Smr/MutS family protein [Jannaschia sp. GRR-S6-38]
MSRRRRQLSPEDRDIWARVTRSADPLHKARRDPAPEPPAKPAPRSQPAPERARVDPFRLGERAKARGSTHSLTPSLPEQVRAQPLRMDAKTHRRMTSGKLRPDAKIDLHGMTLDQAHPALIRFVLGAQAEGRRLLLVVTGKGKRRESEGPIPTRLGVLKHQVPQWLRMPPLGAVVLQVSEAHRSHGGAGAYYVYLRR